MTHRGDMSEEGVQFLISVEDAVVRKVIGGPDWAYALASSLLVDRLDAVIRRNRYLVRSVCGHYHLRLSAFQYRTLLTKTNWSGAFRLFRGGYPRIYENALA